MFENLITLLSKLLRVLILQNNDAADGFTIRNEHRTKHIVIVLMQSRSDIVLYRIYRRMHVFL